MNARQRAQKTFDESGLNLIVGNRSDCPLPPEQLADVEAIKPFIIEAFLTGLTAEVYHLLVDDIHYTLKVKRPEARVYNLDGKYSFLNEVQRRKDFQQLKDQSDTEHAFRNIVTTIYADYRLGIILSPWLEGELISKPTAKMFGQLYATLFASEKVGLFEWDLCSGNIIIDNTDKLWLFDFGYNYPFDPLSELHSDGLDPVFHFVERFETRYLSGWFITNELSEQENLSIFSTGKEQALNVLRQKLIWLQENKVELALVQHTQRLIDDYRRALTTTDELLLRYRLDMFRSHVLDIEDDLHGKSCTLTTLQRISEVQETIKLDYTMLKQQGALFKFNEGKSQQELMRLYSDKLRLAEEYQIS